MQSKRDNQGTFFALAVEQRGGSNKVMATISQLVDISQAEAQVAATYSRGGRPGYRVWLLLRVMILQHLYWLSEPQVDEQT